MLSALSTSPPGAGWDATASMFTTLRTPVSSVARRSTAAFSRFVPTVPEIVTMPLLDATRISRVFKTGSLKSLAWMSVAIAVSSGDFRLLQAPRRSTAIKIANRPRGLCIRYLSLGRVCPLALIGFKPIGLGCTLAAIRNGTFSHIDSI